MQEGHADSVATATGEHRLAGACGRRADAGGTLAPTSGALGMAQEFDWLGSSCGPLQPRSLTLQRAPERSVPRSHARTGTQPRRGGVEGLMVRASRGDRRPVPIEYAVQEYAADDNHATGMRMDEMRSARRSAVDEARSIAPTAVCDRTSDRCPADRARAASLSNYIGDRDRAPSRAGEQHLAPPHCAEGDLANSPASTRPATSVRSSAQQNGGGQWPGWRPVAGDSRRRQKQTVTKASAQPARGWM